MKMNAQKAGTGFYRRYQLIEPTMICFLVTCGCYKDCAADCDKEETDFDVIFLVVPAVVLVILIGMLGKLRSNHKGVLSKKPWITGLLRLFWRKNFEIVLYSVPTQQLSF